MRKLASYVGVPLVLALSSVAAAPAAAAPCPPDTNCPPPTVTTTAATNVTDTTATLNGTVNGNGAAVTYVFAYGPTTTYGSLSNPPGALAPSTVPQNVSATVTGLQPSTTYHFRLAATSTTAPGTPGADMTFTTKPRKRKQPSLTLKVTPKRDRALPYKFTSSGTLKLPSGVARSDGCSGTVSVQIKSGSKTISTRRVKVGSNCTYKSSVTFKSRGRLKARGTLKVTARYGGNAFLKTATAKTVTVRYGS